MNDAEYIKKLENTNKHLRAGIITLRDMYKKLWDEFERELKYG